MAYIFGSIWDRFNRNALNDLSKNVEIQGKSIQDLVADGQLTPEQYATLIQTVNGLISKGSVRPDDLSPDLLELISNSDGTPFNILSIPRDNSVTPNKTTFIETSTNLLDVELGVIESRRLDTDGKLITATSLNLSDYIPVESGRSYTFLGVDSYGEFDFNFNFIRFIPVYSSRTESITRTLGEGVHFIRPAYQKVNKDVARINLGNNILPHEEHYKRLKNISLAIGSVSVEDTDFFRYSEETSTVNLFDKTKVTTGGYYDWQTLEWVTNAQFAQSEFIPVKSGDTITLFEDGISNYVVFKNSNNEIFSGSQVYTGSKTFSVPINATSFSVNVRILNVPNFMIVKNREMPNNYTPFGEVVFSDERINAGLLDYVSENLRISDSESNQKFKSINFLGDSITRGYAPGTGGQLTTTWAGLVAQEFNANTKNYGIDGSTLSGSSESAMVKRYSNMDNEADLVIVSGGTNDWNNRFALGDINSVSETSFYGALKIMMDGLHTKYPSATIVFCTPLHRVGDSSNASGIDLKDYRNAILEVGEMYGIAVLDLYATSGLYPDNTVNHDTYVPDGRHPNVAGHRKMASRIIGFLKTL